MKRLEHRRPPLWYVVVGAVFYASFCGVVLLASTIFGLLNSSNVGIAMLGHFFHPQTPEEIFGKSTLTLLVLGCDEDVTYHSQKVLKAQARSDMILVLKLDLRRHAVSGISIPRDMQWQLPGYRMQKINAYHAIGGNKLSREAVESVLGFSIDRVMSLDFVAFQELVDMVGGVDVDVPKNMNYDDDAGKLHIHLKKGRRHLDGYSAMGFVRFRHSDSDFERQKRQKEFLLALKDKVLAKPLSIPKVADKSMEVMGGALTAEELLSLATFVRTVPPDRIRMGMVPISPGPGTNLVLDEGKLPDSLREFGLIDGTPAGTGTRP